MPGDDSKPTEMTQSQAENPVIEILRERLREQVQRKSEIEDSDDIRRNVEYVIAVCRQQAKWAEQDLERLDGEYFRGAAAARAQTLTWAANSLHEALYGKI